MVAVLGVKEVSKDSYFQFYRKAIEVALCRVFDPQAFPVVVAFNLYALKFIVYTGRKQFLDPFIFCK